MPVRNDRSPLPRSRHNEAMGAGAFPAPSIGESTRLCPDDDPDRSFRRAWRLRTVERAAKPAPVRRPVSLRRVEAVRGQSLHEGGRGLVRCRVAAFLDEHDHAEYSCHARPRPCLRRPAGVAEIGRDRRAYYRSVGYLIEDKHGGFGAGIFPQARDDRRWLPVATCRGAFRSALPLDWAWRFSRAPRGRPPPARGCLPDDLPQIGKSLLDLRRIELRRPRLLAGGCALAGRSCCQLVGLTGCLFERYR